MSFPAAGPAQWAALLTATAGASAALGTVPFLVGPVSLLAGGGGGLAWIVAGILGATFGAVYSAWIVRERSSARRAPIALARLLFAPASWGYRPSHSAQTAAFGSA